MQLLRTPDERFQNLPDYPFEPNYLHIDSGDGGTLRVHYLDEGPRAASPVLLLHGEPSWSFLYRKMVPPLVDAGYRVVAPDLVGFGRSDKPAERSDYTYKRLVDWTTLVIESLDLHDITLFCQDWGGLIGLRIAIDQEGRFARLVVANTGLPVGGEMPDAFYSWRDASQRLSRFPVARIVNSSTTTALSKEVKAGYDAPFPDESYKAGARVLPTLVPVDPEDPEAAANRIAWRKLMKWDKPLLTTFSDSDPITRGGDKPFQRLVPGAKEQAHVTVENAGHFLQEDKGEELAEIIKRFISQTN
ncbi:MAG TPA: haloalkane dehalogenase [candidate division Zixibacteria bacterium]|nr:haloalkane dehalogenase [candidate division Zixibacteria bacterium]